MAVLCRILDHLSVLMDQQEMGALDESGRVSPSLADKLAEVELILGLLVTDVHRSAPDAYVDAANHLVEELRAVERCTKAKTSVDESGAPIRFAEAEIVGVIDVALTTHEDVRAVFPAAARDFNERREQLTDAVANALAKLNHPKELSDFHRATMFTRTLGSGTAEGLVDNAITECGFDPRALRYEEALRVLDLLGGKSASVALAARLAKAQFRAHRIRRNLSDKNDKDGT
jgi:hypothetical protein